MYNSGMANTKKHQPQFYKGVDYSPRNEREQLLVEAILSLENKEEAANFIRDILTLAEIEEFANRATIVKMLLEGYSYAVIAKEIGTSTTTVTRVAHWLYNGCGGYYKVIGKFVKK